MQDLAVGQEFALPRLSTSFTYFRHYVAMRMELNRNADIQIFFLLFFWFID